MPTGPASPTSESSTAAESDPETHGVRRGPLDRAEADYRELNFLQLQSGYLRQGRGTRSSGSQPLTRPPAPPAA
eukprot:12928505-Prorocentrum_lima.AAC.1